MAGSRSSAPDASPNQKLRCSFCDKDQGTVAKIVAGPGVCICNECVDLCSEVIGAGELVPEFGSPVERSDDELLAVLAWSQARISQADAAVHHQVAVLRERGLSWARIGEALGVSKQAVWERFSEED